MWRALGVFYIMENLEWKPFFYNGIETTVEVTRCEKVKRIKKEWSKGTKFGLVENIALANGYKYLPILIKRLGKKIFIYIN